MKKTLLLFVFLLGSFFSVQAQSDLNYCGTPPEKSEWLTRYQQNPGAFEKSNTTLYVPVTIHIVGKNDGSGYFPENRVLDAFCTLNEDFLETDIQFFIEGEFNYINNNSWYEHNFNSGGLMMQFNNVSSTVNCYIVEDPAGNCGYYSPQRQGVALAKGCLGFNDHTWTHEMGHFLSLPHPFLGWEGYDDHDYSTPAPTWVNDRQVEKLNGSNCNFAGDGFCDTPPDYLNYRWNCNNNGESSLLQTDPNGETFRSDGTLFMSYSNGNCSSRFSDDQIDAMRANLEDQRPYLLYDQTPGFAVTEAPVLSSPVSDQQLPVYDQVTLQWEAVPNATHYFVQLTFFPNFTVVSNSAVTDQTSVTFTGLDRPNSTYRWRVRPFNAHDACASFTNSETFETGALTGIQEQLALHTLSLFPNPVSQQAVNLELFSAKSFEANILIFDLTGKRMQPALRFPVITGQNRLTLPLDDLAAGVYFVVLQSEEDRITRRIVVK